MIDDRIVWETVTSELAPLAEAIAAFLAELPPR